MKLFNFKGLNERRWQLFRKNKRGYWSLWIFSLLFLISLFAPWIANDRPILASYKGELLYPTFIDYPEEKFGGFLAITDFRDQLNQDEISANGWMIWPPIRYAHNTVNKDVPKPAPSPPVFQLSKEDRCNRYPETVGDKACIFGNMNWLGTDDQGRDVLARLIYGFRISVAFGLMLTLFSSIIGMFAGAVQGYFGGWTDLLFVDADTLSFDHSRCIHNANLLAVAVHSCALLVDGTGQCCARRVSPRPQF
jgi:microcin C transport system permease protein